ncbi:hypothetical protein C7S17_5835 [Burkholderia thailandensis]|nr:hypothetical protein [Burkholderia thailandensis]
MFCPICPRISHPYISVNQLDPFTSCPVASIPIQLDKPSFPIKHLRTSRHLDRS